MKKTFLLFLIVACGSLLRSQTSLTFTYTGKPTYQIDVKRGGIFLGTIKVELFPTIAPHHVRNFDSLVSVQFYDSTAFHRVIPGFMIQGGDPNSRHGATSTWGYGQPGQPTVNAEFSVAKHLRGILSAARSSNINSATSQFFICVAPAPSLNGQYSVYGRVVAGMNWVDTIVNAPRNANDLPNVKHEMFITYVGSNDSIPNKPVLNTPANHTGTINVAAQQMFKWNNVPGAVIYTLEIASDSLFTNIVKTVETGNLLTYISNAFTANTQYFWRVIANNGGHYSDYSNVWDFGAATTNTLVTGISNNTALSGELTVYPNPSNSRFTISGLAVGDQVEVYDLQGKLIYQAKVKETLHTIDLETQPKGIYNCLLISEGKEKSRQRLILR